MGQIVKKGSPIEKWQKHFSKGTDQLQRIPLSKVTFETGLSEKKLFQIQKETNELDILQVLAESIKSLLDFLNMATSMNPNQVYETAELVLSEYNDLSITSINDCFKMIKLSTHPFDSKMYERIDGRKIIALLKMYREFQVDQLQKKHQENKEVKTNTLTDFLKTQDKESSQEFADKFRKKRVAKILEEPVKPKVDFDKIVQGWIREFDEMTKNERMKNAVYTSEEYLKIKEKAYSKELQNQQKAKNNAE